MALVCNLVAGPGAGKSTTAAGVFHELKMRGYNAEYVQEYAKDITWEDASRKLENQVYILGKQWHRLWRVATKVDIVVTDCPLFLSLVYGEGEPQCFKDLVLYLHGQNDNLNYFVDRKKKYNPLGRNQTELEARAIDESVIRLLDEYEIPHLRIPGDSTAVGRIVYDIETHMRIL
jgi:hypothetical protein